MIRTNGVSFASGDVAQGWLAECCPTACEDPLPLPGAIVPVVQEGAVRVKAACWCPKELDPMSANARVECQTELTMHGTIPFSKPSALNRAKSRSHRFMPVVLADE